jgi:hypothetical protein
MLVAQCRRVPTGRFGSAPWCAVNVYSSRDMCEHILAQLVQLLAVVLVPDILHDKFLSVSVARNWTP